MLRGHRGIFAAIVGLALLGASPPKDAGGQSANATVNQIEHSLGDIASTLKQAIEPSQHDKPCPEGRNDRSSDLCAQWKAADAAKSAAQAAWWIGCVGALIGGLTLAAAFNAAKWAKKAAEHTEAGANAAIDANRQSKLSAERQDRAYVAVQPAGIHKFLQSEGPHLAIGHVTIKNVGSMTAKNVASFVTMEVVPINMTKDFPITDDPGRIERAIQVGDEMRQAAGNTSIPGINEVNKSDIHVYVWGVVYYDDGFDNRRFTKFCHRYPGARVQYEDLPPVPEGVRNLARYMPRPFADELIPAKYARHYEHGNDAD